jgi:hypothetical protein
MRFSDDPCYRCRGNLIIDLESYKGKMLKIVYWPYRFIQKFFVRDLEKREIELSNQIQELNKFKHVNVDAINSNTFNNLERCFIRMQNRINKLVVPDDFTEEFQFIFDLKHDLNEFEKHYNKIKKLPKEVVTSNAIR